MSLFKLKYIFAQSLSNVIFRNMTNGHRILMYHSIYDQKKDLFFFDDLHTVKILQFQKQVDYLKNYNVVSLNNENIIKKNSFSITFDDGYLDNYINAYPYLQQKKLPWTLYIVSDFLNSKNKEFVNKNHLIEMAKNKLITIGSHGKTHRRLTTLSINEIKKELEYSKKNIEDIIGKEVKTFSYPHGDANLDLLNHVKEAGYSNAVCSYPYINDVNINTFLLNRQSIIINDNINYFRNKINGKFDWTRIRFKDPKKYNEIN